MTIVESDASPTTDQSEMQEHELALIAPLCFGYWAGLDTPATRDTELDDWDFVAYREAVCFTRKGATTQDAYLVSGTSIVHFGFDHDTLESAYQMITQLIENVPESALVSGRRLAERTLTGARSQPTMVTPARS